MMLQNLTILVIFSSRYLSKFRLKVPISIIVFVSTGPDLRGVVDDKQVVSWRKGNKAGILLSAVIDKDVKVGDDIVTGFALKFVYTNTVPALDSSREVQTSDVTAPVYVVLGKME